MTSTLSAITCATSEVRRHLRLGVFAASVRVPGRVYATAGRERRMWWPYLVGDRAIYGSARAMYGEDPKTLLRSHARPRSPTDTR